MEPRSDVEMEAVTRARRVAKREQLLQRAHTSRLTYLVLGLQAVVVALVAAWLEGRSGAVSSVAILVFLVLLGNIMQLHSRVDALLTLLVDERENA